LSVDQRVLAFLKNNPGATPREIADALGMPLSSVRAALYRLREAGYVVRSTKGGYVVRVVPPVISEGVSEPGRSTKGGYVVRVVPPVISEGVSEPGSRDLDKIKDIIEDLVSTVNYLKNEVDRLSSRIRKLEQELDLLRIASVKSGGRRPYKSEERSERSGEDLLVKELREKGILSVEEAKKIARKPLESYISNGSLVPVAGYLVSQDFLSNFKAKFPLHISEVRNLSSSEKVLLDAMIKEGLVYLHAGREYRIIE